jgi:hypothetical protein
LFFKAALEEAEAAAQLHVRVHTLELALEDAQVGFARATAANASAIVNASALQADHTRIMTEFKGLLADKDDVADTRHTEHEKMRAVRALSVYRCWVAGVDSLILQELEGRVKQARIESEEKYADYESKVR